MRKWWMSCRGVARRCGPRRAGGRARRTTSARHPGVRDHAELTDSRGAGRARGRGRDPARDRARSRHRARPGRVRCGNGHCEDSGRRCGARRHRTDAQSPRRTGGQVDRGRRRRFAPAVRFDSCAFQRVVANLVRNAGEAMPYGGVVAVRAFAREGRVVLSVADTGPGITAHELPRIFEPFYSTKPREASAGTGLATVYDLLTAHGANIRAGSTPGGGAKFEIDFPVSTN